MFPFYSQMTCTGDAGVVTKELLASECLLPGSQPADVTVFFSDCLGKDKKKKALALVRWEIGGVG